MSEMRRVSGTPQQVGVDWGKVVGKVVLQTLLGLPLLYLGLALLLGDSQCTDYCLFGFRASRWEQAYNFFRVGVLCTAGLGLIPILAASWAIGAVATALFEAATSRREREAQGG